MDKPGENLKSWRSAGNWAIVYILNLPICLFLGWGATQGSGRFGMFAGIVLLFALGLWASNLSRLLDLALIVGGIVVGLSQFAPIAQLLVGGFCVNIVAGLSETNLTPDPPTLRRFEGGLLATLATGGILMTVALLIGLFIRLITPGGWWGGRHRQDATGKKLILDDLHDFQ